MRLPHSRTTVAKYFCSSVRAPETIHNTNEILAYLFLSHEVTEGFAFISNDMQRICKHRELAGNLFKHDDQAYLNDFKERH